MAVPARKTAKAKKRLRRSHQALKRPEISFDDRTGDYRRSHHVSLKGYYKGRQVIKAGE
ncbi:50S ribosomal protein L32 [Enterococcus pseudoavium]|uniref:Large ribosomal subunit protein bL32 n=1 Tax=Enterococcus pseudoavium TaxID=44007 RepID=A0ABU3FE15_9ENTE|nr:50S ribosomal protein L32 [Enterococcus pseudoavium]MDT2755627.1 50S ribosomal protein L32 [Enterococcus pseudoavium]MDT2769276.1 50S ribosomal protein L32 [Enterococcus pseudoavium]